MAYDPYNQIIYFCDNARAPRNKAIYKYNVNTGVKSTWVSDVTTIGMQIFGNGMGSGGGSFYDGDLYLGQDMLTNGEPASVYRIDIDSTTGNAIKAYRVWSKLGNTGSSLYDWADFVINDGVFYNFNSSPTRVANTGVEHIDLNKDSTTAGYSLTSTVVNGSQVGINYQGNIYHFNTSNYALYTPGTGTIGATTSYSGTGSIPLTDAAESFKYPYDYGDAPATYGVAYHKFGTAPKLMIGTKIDYEMTNLANPTANGDDNKNTGSTNDEDGVTSFNPISTSWYSYTVNVKVTNTTGANAYLYGYLDFDRNGTFDTLKNERSALTTVANGATTVNVVWYGLTAGSMGASFIRFRIGSVQSQARLPFGYASDGEDEDYPFTINQVNLPVELVDFKGELKENKSTLLSWSTASELNNDYFDVQRKKQDGSDWESIGKVKGFGNSNQLRNYSLIDEQPQVGENYYRLNQVDFGGKSEYSSTIMIKLDAAATDKKDAFVVYPTPARNEIWIKTEDNTISADKTMPIDVFNITGERIYSALLQENLQRIDLADYQKGMYFIKIGTKTYKIVKE